jgi:tRNA threonylcarbamoyladenosine biosynthesis protein TsaE
LQFLLQIYANKNRRPIPGRLSSKPGCKYSQYICSVELEFSIENIKQAAMQFWSLASGKRVFAFQGNLGAGKTTFIHALCDVKGVKDVVGSPTFSIINEYVFDENGQIKKIYHIDLFRLKDEEEAIQAGVEDCLYGEHICFVEWPEKAPHIIPQDTIYACIRIVDQQTRQISLQDKLSPLKL